MNAKELPSRVRERLELLRDLEEALLDLAMRCLTAHERAVSPMDFLSNAASNRALALSSGFRRMIEERNLICAGSLLRMQLDTTLRFHAAWLVEDPHSFALEVLKGTRIDKLKGRDGRRLQDFYLVEKLSKKEGCEWIPRVYEETSGYVHLSGKHMFSTFGEMNSAEGTVSIKIGAADCEWPEEIYLEAVDAFLAATRLVMNDLHAWGVMKQNPEIQRASKTS